MMRKSYWVILLSIIIVVAAGLIYQRRSLLPNDQKKAQESEVGTAIGQLAPDLTLKRLDGEDISVSELRGKKVLLNFWASWCAPCRMEKPDLQRLYDDYRGRIEVLAVNQGEAKGVVSEYMMINGYSFPIALDLTGQASDKYLIRGIPTTFFLDEQGIIMNKQSGVLNYNQMLQLLKIEQN